MNGYVPVEREEQSSPEKQKGSGIMNRRKGFTLIELLVVISIIALLMAILIPVLNAAKASASGASCLNNQKNLVTAWFTYTIENDGRLVDGRTDVGVSWVYPPVTSLYSPVPTEEMSANLDNEKWGIQRGALFPYVREVDVYHCPFDKRYRKKPTSTPTGSLTTETGGFRSYSIYQCLNGGSGSTHDFEFHSEIKNPADKYVFIEEDDPRGLNKGSWALDTVDKPDMWDWTDRMAILHNKKSTLGWADCHATMERWKDKRTIRGAQMTEWSDWQDFRNNQIDNPDLAFMKKHAPHRGLWNK
jgi:prepilin-type N-terminal cleavage/methylation domain-containing protein